jgi:hypothetical protein
MQTAFFHVLQLYSCLFACTDKSANIIPCKLLFSTYCNCIRACLHARVRARTLFHASFLSHAMHSHSCVVAFGRYDRCSISEWFKTSDTSPLTGLKLPHKNLIDNSNLRHVIQQYAAEKQSRLTVVH